MTEEADMEERKIPQNPESEKPEFQVIDKRHFLEMGEADPEPGGEKPRYPTFVEELMARMAEMEKKFEEKKQQIHEEIERTKARLESDFNRQLELEKQKIVLPFLEVLDNLERAMDAAAQSSSMEDLKNGIQLTAGLFRSKLQAIGVEAIESLDLPFNPNLAQAIGRVAVSDADRDGIVVEECQAGYTMRGQLLRPAQVRVGHCE
jgi:molecular chaperone GrpE